MNGHRQLHTLDGYRPRGAESPSGDLGMWLQPAGASTEGRPWALVSA